MWFTYATKVGRITPAGVISSFALPSYGVTIGITAGPDGALWFTDRYCCATPHVGRVTTAGAITQLTLPHPVGSTDRAFSGPIVAGADGKLWASDYWDGFYLTSITTGGLSTDFKVSTLSASIGGLTLGADGKVWFTEPDAGKIGAITSVGIITEFALPSGSHPKGITSASDGNLWFTDGARIRRMSPTGLLASFPIPTATAEATLITTGPNGDVWFSEYDGIAGVGKLAKIVP